MSISTDHIPVTFHPGRKQSTVSLQAVRDQVTHFLEHYCDTPFVPVAFADSLGGETGEERFSILLEQAGYAGEPHGFLREVVRHLEQASNGSAGDIAVGGVALPYHLLLAVLEVLVPGQGFVSIKRVSKLEELTNTEVPAEEREAMQEVLNTYPVRLSHSTVRQMRISKAIAHQYYPFVHELSPEGETHTWVGQFFRGIIEQMYRNRVIFVMNMACPVYCRFCFRKHKECRNQTPPIKAHVKQAVAYVKEMPEIKEIVLTGGDPFMNKATLRHAIAELAKVPHIRTLRLASRAVSYFPELFLKGTGSWVHYLIRTNLELMERGKRLELATHFLHPDELSIGALDIISRLVQSGIPVYIQTPFVQGCNDSGEPLVPLYNALRAAGAEIHYIFMPTSPIQGNAVYWSSIADGLKAARHLRAHLSDRAMPHITTATSIGKIDWNNSGWALERDEDDPAYLWIRTPYNLDYYQDFAPIMQLGDRVRHNAEGTLDAAFRCEIGDEDLLAGPRTPSSSIEAFQYKLDKTDETVSGWLEVLQSRCMADQRALDLHLGARPAPCLAREHLARVELDCGAPEEELAAAVSYIRGRPEITDVVLSRKEDILHGFSRTLHVLDDLVDTPSVLAIRLRSKRLLSSPGAYSTPVISRLAGRNKLRIVRPHRLELELVVLHASELSEAVGQVVQRLRLSGITVYANVPLLGYINDNSEELLRISGRCRDLGVELANVYVCGTPVQARWNAEHPVDLNAVVGIATHVRRRGSGREVPRYLVRTPLGEVDFGIRPRVFSMGPGGEVRATLRPHDLAYYQLIDPDFAWPEGTELDEQGHPIVPLQGVALDNPEFLAGPLDR